MKRRTVLRVAPWLVALALFALALRTVPLDDTWHTLRLLGVRQLVALVVVNGLIVVALTARWWFILRGHGCRVPFWTLLGYRQAAFGLSYFTPGPQFGGEPLQVYFVEREQGVSRATAVATTALDKLLELSVNFAFLLAGVLIIVQGRLFGESVGMETAVFALLLLLLPVAFLVATWANWQPAARLMQFALRLSVWQRWPQWHGRFQRAQRGMATSEREAARFFRSAPLALLAGAAASVTAWALMVAEFWLMVYFLEVPLTPVELIIILTAARIAFLLLLPGGLGVLEASLVLAFGALGLNPAVGLSASLLIRARDVILGASGLFWGSRRFNVVRSGQSTPFQPLSKEK